MYLPIMIIKKSPMQFDSLVKVNNSHAIVFDDTEIVILKKKESIRLEQTLETRGLVFFINFPKYWKAIFKDNSYNILI